MRLKPVFKALATAALFAAVLVPASAAGRTRTSVKLAVVPLPKSAIGSAAKPLQLSQLSGVVSNTAAVNPLTQDTAAYNGRVSGYMLDYGNAASGGSGITNVRTSVERYKSSDDARLALGYLKEDDAQLAGHLSHGALTVKSTRVKVLALGKARFAYLTSFSAANSAPLATLDERILEGKYLLQVQVSAGTRAEAKTLAAKLAKKLDARFKLALKGRLHAKPVALPRKQTAGRPVGGPDLSALALKTSDLTGSATLVDAAYCPCGGYEVSRYEVNISPAGPFEYLYQAILWYPTANEAAFRTDVNIAHVLAHGYNALNVSSLGHGAQGVIGDPSSTGRDAAVRLNVGQLVEVLVAWPLPERALQTSDLLSVARTAATRLDTVYTP